MSQSPIKVIVDTNVWINYLIGYQLQGLDELLISGRIKLIISEELINEVKRIAAREKFAKYFSVSKVDSLIDFMVLTSELYELGKTPKVCRDPKDDFLLALAKKSDAHFIISGDQELLVMEKFEKTKIISPSDFLKRV